MTPLVTFAVLIAAITHASWNAIAHGIRDQLLAFTLVGGGGALCGLALAPFTALPAAGAWPYLLASAVIHVVYYVLLMRSFHLGDFGQMYPIARGTAPLVVTVLGAVFVGETPDGWQAAGIALASAGLVGVALWGVRSSRRPRADAPAPVPTGGPPGSQTTDGPPWLALTAAIATGLSIAAYTVVDGLGVRASGTPLGYIAWLMIWKASPSPPTPSPPAAAPSSPDSARSPAAACSAGCSRSSRTASSSGPRPEPPSPRSPPSASRPSSWARPSGHSSSKNASAAPGSPRRA